MSDRRPFGGQRWVISSAPSSRVADTRSSGSSKGHRRPRHDGQDPVFCAIAPSLPAATSESEHPAKNQNVKIVGRNGGFTYADLGSTHHSLEDYALMRTIPGVTAGAPGRGGRGAVHAMLHTPARLHAHRHAASVPSR
jgi:hypothetical protein